jgi:hypothetical protein
VDSKGKNMTEKTISYKEIPQYASYAATTNTQIKVVLSKYQAYLFHQKIKMMKHISNKSFIGNAYDTLKFLAVLLAIGHL